ncbi:MAG: class IV adenylate cyclase [Candidatus Pacebacteria bacterium]|nr:class IV adenylate cyclase [Candidatus Paceibacterota bacterium]
MKEIEVKARLKNKDEVMKKLESLGCVFEKPITQSDVVYAKKVGSFKEYDSNEVFLRVRVKNNSKIIFTAKQRIKNGLDKLENETEVTNKKGIEGILAMLGYKEGTRVNKTLRTAHYQAYEICIDEIEELGSFIEMESLVEDGDSEKIQEEMFKFLASLGVNSKDRVFLGYDLQILKAKEG